MKAVLHAHSTWSYDGRWELDRIARTFGRLGIDAVLMTEHDTGFVPDSFGAYRDACADASTDRCRLIPGIEYSCPDNDVHILTWGLTHFLAEHRPVIETLGKVRAAGGVAVFAHPVRREAWRLFQPDWTPYLSGIELWNRKSDGLTWGAEAARLIAETGLPATVGMDFHHTRHFYPLLMRFGIDSHSDVEQALVAEIGAGRGRATALGMRVLDRGGSPGTFPHGPLERGRRALRDLVRRH